MSYPGGSLGLGGMGIGVSGTTPSTTDATKAQATATPTQTPGSAAGTLTSLIHRLRAFVLKNLWLVVLVAVGAVLLYTRTGRSALCDNLGLACDTRPLPGGVRALD